MRDKTAGLPPLTAALVLIGTWLQAQREERGRDWCFKHGIGAMRRILFASGALMRGREAKAYLAGLCGECPHQDCPMKRWHLTVAPYASGRRVRKGTAKT